ncbi:MAG: MarR family transcriptional regulator [Sphingomonadaceae bacterium]|nr:MarR family transcriptional regulator [Sphingomonadaceae bacterium]
MSERLDDVGYGDGPTLLLLTDDAAAQSSWTSAAEAAGCRLLAVVPIPDAATRLSRQAAADVVVLDTRGDEAPGVDAALDQMERGAESRSFSAIAAAPLRLAERITRQLHPQVHHLLDADAVDRQVALAEALIRSRPRFEDVNKTQGTLRLQQLSEEVGRIAAILAALSEDDTAAAAMASLEAREGSPEALEAAQVRAVIRARRLRDHFFRGELFADPAWDMLLDLMAARLEKQRVAVSSLCIAAAVPPTTALRWIKTLCDQGLFVRVADPEDGRRVFIELSAASAAAMESYFEAARRVAPMPV